MLSPRYWTFLTIVLLAVMYSVYQHSQSIDTVSSPADPYQYRYLVLDNGVKTLLVSTPEADKAAAAVSVQVGSGDDPSDRPGLAHFLEHMLFLGTEPYPDAGEYQAYISRHGGSHNAFTAHAQTTYFFDIDNNELAGALDRFAPFFISPTFNEAYVEREKNAVHAEYSAKLRDDFRRIYSAEKQAMNPKHPYASFSTGNLDTLSDQPDSLIRDELLEFYKQHYSADRMTLVLAGNYSLQELEDWAVSHFSDVPKRPLNTTSNTEPLFTPGELPLDLNIEPVKEIRRLQFSFPMPASKHLYENKPVQVLSNLIGHEGEGSLLALLKGKGWAEGLSAGRSLANDNETLLVIQVNLTRQGLMHVDNITQALMHYIDLLKQQPLPAYLSEEQARLSELAFRFHEHGQISDYVVRLSSNLLIYPPQDVLYGDYKWIPPKQEALEPFLQALNADNMLRTLIAPNITTDTLDPWYSTPIRVRPGQYLAQQVHTDGLDRLTLPKPNPFIPEKLDVDIEATVFSMPQLLLNKDMRQVWYYPEHDFQQPRARLHLLLGKTALQQSARKQILARLYTRAINDALNTYSYPAYLAGLSYSLSTSSRGLSLNIAGYQDKLPELLKRILAEMNKMQLDDEQFQRYQNSIRRTLENQLKGKPYKRSLDTLKQWLYQPSFSQQQLLAELEKVTRDDVEQYSSNIKQSLSHTLYIHGSLTEQMAMHLAEQIQQSFPANEALTTPALLRQLPKGLYQQELALDHQDKAMTLYIQGQNTSDRRRATFSLLGQILSAPYYQYMRTENQLGYIVFAASYPQQTVPALAFIVQSPTTSPQKLLAYSQTFFKQFADQLNAMTDDEFAKFQQGLINILTQKPKNMAEKDSYFWHEINQQRYSFDTRQAIADEVATLTLQDVQTLYQQAVLEQKHPWLVITQGGKLEGFDQLDSLNREELPLYLPKAPEPPAQQP